jgi:hypothetical protein
MTLIEPVMFLGVLVCGMLVGSGIAGAVGFIRGAPSGDLVVLGAVFGVTATFIALFVCSWWFVRVNRIHPACRCGKSGWKDIQMSKAVRIRNVWRCSRSKCIPGQNGTCGF